VTRDYRRCATAAMVPYRVGGCWTQETNNGAIYLLVVLDGNEDDAEAVEDSDSGDDDGGGGGGGAATTTARARAARARPSTAVDVMTGWRVAARAASTVILRVFRVVVVVAVGHHRTAAAERLYKPHTSVAEGQHLREKDKSSVQYAKTPPLCFGCCTLFGSLRNREPRNTAKEECAAMAACAAALDGRSGSWIHHHLLSAPGTRYCTRKVLRDRSYWRISLSS
jgi:hypothetical protein